MPCLFFFFFFFGGSRFVVKYAVNCCRIPLKTQVWRRCVSTSKGEDGKDNGTQKNKNDEEVSVGSM